MLSPAPMARPPSLSHQGAPGVQDISSLRWIPLKDMGCDATRGGRGQGKVTAQRVYPCPSPSPGYPCPGAEAGRRQKIQSRKCQGWMGDGLVLLSWFKQPL